MKGADSVMFNRKGKVKVQGVSSNSYGKLLYDLVFISNNIKKLDFVNGIMVSKNSLNGNIYVGNSNISLSEINNVDEILKRVDLIDMIYFYGNTKEVQVYSYEYHSHFVSSTFVEITFRNGSTKKIIFS